MRNLVWSARDGHHFIWNYDSGDEASVVNLVAEQADDPESVFTWLDAGHVIKEVRRLEYESRPATRFTF